MAKCSSNVNAGVCKQPELKQVWITAFPEKLTTHNERQLGQGEWEYFDEIEDDLHTLRLEVAGVLNPCKTRNFFRRADRLLEEIKFDWGYDGFSCPNACFPIEVAASMVLNFFRFAIHRQILDDRRDVSYDCYVMLMSINNCEINIWNGCAKKRSKSNDDETTQFLQVIKKNRPYIRSQHEPLRQKIENVIAHNFTAIQRGRLSAREAIRNVEMYVSSEKGSIFDSLT